MSRSRRVPWLALAAIGGLIYPFIVYFGLSVLSPQGVILIGLAIIAIRMLGLCHMAGSVIWLVGLGGAAGVVGGISMLSPDHAVRLYPVIISVSVAAIFALSLHYPPTVIERLARLTEPDLPPAGVAYTRTVTRVWVVFLLGNAAISAATTLWGSLELWMLWNGLLSYFAMGLLFVGEYAVRRRIRSRTVM